MAKSPQISKTDVPAEVAPTAKRGRRKAVVQTHEVHADTASHAVEEGNNLQLRAGTSKVRKIKGANRKRRNFRVLHGKILKELLEKAQWELNLFCEHLREGQKYSAQFSRFQEELSKKK
ncbi:MAG: hypothetical protein GY696_39100 [Gammaproteobacteria bacterium]|nr:hypothetical protein [Gammaproteobacteria bacterium]